MHTGNLLGRCRGLGWLRWGATGLGRIERIGGILLAWHRLAGNRLAWSRRARRRRGARALAAAEAAISSAARAESRAGAPKPSARRSCSSRRGAIAQTAQ